MLNLAVSTNGLFLIGTDIDMFFAEMDSILFLQDSDGDTIPDFFEINGMQTSNRHIYYTNYLEKDTDEDGLDDNKEILFEFNSETNEISFIAKSDPTSKDSDDDGYADGPFDVFQNGMYDDMTPFDVGVQYYDVPKCIINSIKYSHLCYVYTTKLNLIPTPTKFFYNTYDTEKETEDIFGYKYSECYYRYTFEYRNKIESEAWLKKVEFSQKLNNSANLITDIISPLGDPNMQWYQFTEAGIILSLFSNVLTIAEKEEFDDYLLYLNIHLSVNAEETPFCVKLEKLVYSKGMNDWYVTFEKTKAYY